MSKITITDIVENAGPYLYSFLGWYYNYTREKYVGNKFWEEHYGDQTVDIDKIIDELKKIQKGGER